MTELEDLKLKNEMLKIKNNALNELLENTCTKNQLALAHAQLKEVEDMLENKTNELNRIRKDLHKQMEININQRYNFEEFCKNALIYFVKELKRKACSDQEKAFCDKMQITINHLMFQLKHATDKVL